MISIGKYRIFLLDSFEIETEILQDKIISCTFNDNIFKTYSEYRFICIFDKSSILSKMSKVKLYYELNNSLELKMVGFITNPVINPFEKTMVVSIFPITYFLAIQGANPTKRYENTNLMQNIISVIKDNLKNSTQSFLNGFPSISFNGFEFGIIPPIRQTIQDDLLKEKSRSPAIKTTVLDYIQSIANQCSVHITTLVYNSETYLYLLDNGTVINNKILKGKIPKITQKDLSSIKNSFVIERNPIIMIDELKLFQDSNDNEGGFNNYTQSTKIDINNLFPNAISDEKEFIASFFKSDVGLDIVRYEERQSLLEQNSLRQASKFVAETLLAKGMSITCNIKSEKDENGIDFLIGSYVDISDLFISSGMTNKTISPYNFIIAGISYSYSLDGIEKEIVIAPAFLLEN